MSKGEIHAKGRYCPETTVIGDCETGPTTHGSDRHRLKVRLAPSVWAPSLVEDSFPLDIYGE